MNQPAGYKEMFGYFRMGLVTGLVDKAELIAWADREIMRCSIPEPEIIELSLSGKRPYSEIIWLLNQFEHGSHYQTSVNLLLARAGSLVEEADGQITDIIMGLRLLIEEEWLAKDIKAQLHRLRHSLEEYQSQAISAGRLAEQLTQFLAPYHPYRAQLTSLLGT